MDELSQSVEKTRQMTEEDALEIDPAAAAEASEDLPDTYRRLRDIAHQQLRRYRPGATLNTTALVHEAWIRLSADQHHMALPRDEFLKLASTAMRRLIVDYARRRNAIKRGGGAFVIELDEQSAESGGLPVLDVIAMDAALRELGKFDAHLENVVECRFFAGLTMDETAAVLARPVRSVERDWARARAYLVDALEPR
jgi:RNA polymerase sigma factor (TIGR02999 family)